MTRYELESWCEKFLQEIFENAQPVVEFIAKAVKEDMSEEQMAAGLLELSKDSKTYTDYKGKLADFIENHAKELNK